MNHEPNRPGRAGWGWRGFQFGLLVLGLLAQCALAAGPGVQEYYPPRGEWQRETPARAGFDAARLAQAVTYAQSKAVLEPGDMRQVLLDHYREREPDYRVLGPTADRQDSAGLIIRHGRIVAEWGDLERVDMSFSVVKSYLSSVAGLAWQQGLIDDLQRPVRHWVRDGHFDTPHNQPITWHHMLQQTSDWSGRLWEVDDWADRPEGDDPARWPERELHAPGTYFKYNDVRVNLLAYALLQVWREPLPQVLKREILDPIGASTTWRWYGYDNSWVELDGLRMQSVSGGGHFGGGLFMNTYDHARYGLLLSRQGRWQTRQILQPDWLQQARQPSTVKPDYGYLWWLNTARARIPGGPEEAFWAAGFGGHYIYIDQRADLVLVLRWIPDLAGVVERVMASCVDCLAITKP